MPTCITMNNISLHFHAMNNVSKPTSVTDTFEVYKAGYPTSYHAQRIRKDLKGSGGTGGT